MKGIADMIDHSELASTIAMGLRALGGLQMIPDLVTTHYGLLGRFVDENAKRRCAYLKRSSLLWLLQTRSDGNVVVVSAELDGKLVPCVLHVVDGDAMFDFESWAMIDGDVEFAQDIHAMKCSRSSVTFALRGYGDATDRQVVDLRNQVHAALAATTACWDWRRPRRLVETPRHLLCADFRALERQRLGL
jgi:hypothetical protein